VSESPDAEITTLVLSLLIMGRGFESLALTKKIKHLTENPQFA